MVDSHYASIGGVNMPKAKPTQVIVHRIELQEKERDMLEVYVAGKTARNLVEPAIAVGSAWVAYKSAKALHEWGEDWYDRLQERLAVLGSEDPIGAAEAAGKPWWYAFYLPFALGLEK